MNTCSCNILPIWARCLNLRLTLPKEKHGESRFLEQGVSSQDGQECYPAVFRKKTGTPRAASPKNQVCPVLYDTKTIILFIETNVTKFGTLLALINIIILLISMISKPLGHSFLSPEFLGLVLSTSGLWSWS